MKIHKFELGSVNGKLILLSCLWLMAVKTSGATVVLQTLRSFGQLGAMARLFPAADGNLYGTTAADGTNGAGTVFRMTTNGLLTVLHSFTGGEDRGGPAGGVIQGSDGYLYGTTSEESASGAGTVFRLTTDGALATLHYFTGLNDGGDPTGLVQASDGNLYGTTLFGGNYGDGTVFRISTNGAMTTLYALTGADEPTLYGDAANPSGTLIQAHDGHLYGTSIYGGANHRGTVYRITSRGVFTVIYRFDGTNGANPRAGLIEASDGTLYGTTVGGGPGTNDNGTVFRITLQGVFTRLHVFAGGNGGGNPYGALVQAPNGILFGTTQSGGTTGYGTVFRLTTNGVFSIVHSFIGTDGAYPFRGMALASDGNLYGTTIKGGAFGNGTAFRVTPNGVFNLVQSFPEGYTGGNPVTGLAVAGDGQLFGTTIGGGSAHRGTVFSIGTDGALKALHDFRGAPAEGQTPRGSLIRASDGNLYGTTESGGTNDAGTVYRITPAGSFTVLRSFTGGGIDGAHLWSALVQGLDGRLYGTTGDGGANGMGTAFAISLNGTFTRLYSFTTTVGGGPRSSLMQANDGRLYGVCTSGGTRSSGAVYRLSTNGVFALLHSFSGGTNGNYPTAPLMQASDGQLYGTTDFGGAGDTGTIYRLTTNGLFTLVHSFTGLEGERPSGGLVAGSDGNLYGSTSGNFQSHGSVFQITTDGVFTLLYTFAGNEDGSGPSELVQGGDGNLYGTTYAGGILSAGTVFRILIAPPVLRSEVLRSGESVFSFETVTRQRYTIEARPDLGRARWVTYMTVEGDGRPFPLAIPTNYYPEQYFRISKQ